MAKICVEIELETDDGTFTVSQCDPSEPEQVQGGMPGMEAGGEAENDGQKYTTLKEALRAAAELLTSTGGETNDAQLGFDRAMRDQPSGDMGMMKGGM